MSRIRQENPDLSEAEIRQKAKDIFDAGAGDPGLLQKLFTTDGEIDYGKIGKGLAIGTAAGIGGKLAYDYLKPKKKKDEDEDKA